MRRQNGTYLDLFVTYLGPICCNVAVTHLHAKQLHFLLCAGARGLLAEATAQLLQIQEVALRQRTSLPLPSIFYKLNAQLCSLGCVHAA